MLAMSFKAKILLLTRRIQTGNFVDRVIFKRPDLQSSSNSPTSIASFGSTSNPNVFCRYFIPTRHVRVIEAPQVPAASFALSRAEMPEPPAVWTQRRVWDPRATPPEAQIQELNLETGPEAEMSAARDGESDVSGETAVDTSVTASPVVGRAQGCLALTSGRSLTLIGCPHKNGNIFHD